MCRCLSDLRSFWRKDLAGSRPWLGPQPSRSEQIRAASEASATFFCSLRLLSGCLLCDPARLACRDSTGAVGAPDAVGRRAHRVPLSPSAPARSPVRTRLAQDNVVTDKATCSQFLALALRCTRTPVMSLCRSSESSRCFSPVWRQCPRLRSSSTEHSQMPLS